MPNTLMDMFQPHNLADNSPIGFGDALAQNRQSLIGLGMGLLQPISLAQGAPAQSPMSNALGGYQQGAAQDARQANVQAQLAHQKRQEAFQRAQAAQHQANFERTFARGDVTEAQKAYRDIYGDRTDVTPEEKASFYKQYYLPKTEGEWQLAKLPHPTIPGDEITVERNKRTGETRLPQYPGVTAAPASSADAGASAPAPAPAPAIAPAPVSNFPSAPSEKAPAGYRWGGVDPKTGRRMQEPIEGGPATKLPEGSANRLALLDAAKPAIEEAKKYFLDPTPLYEREGGGVFGAGKQLAGQATGSFEIGRQQRNVRYAIEAALRAATGAAAPETEVKRYADMYSPDIMDSYRTRKQKMDALDRFFASVEQRATQGHVPSGSQSIVPSPSGGGDGAPVRVTSPGQARNLPSGTRIILPDGSEGRVP